MANEVMKASAQTAVIVPEIWSARFYEVLLAKLPFIDAVDKSYEGEIQDLGDTVNISTIPEFDDAAELAEGARGDSDSVTVTGQQLVINKRTFKDFIVTSRAKLQSIEFMDQLRDKATYAIQKRMQAVIIGDISPLLANQLSYASSTTLALADILSVKEALDGLDVPEEDRQAVLGTAQANDLFNITGFTSRDFIPAGSPLTSGAINTPVAGFSFKMTTVVGNTSYWFHPSFMTMAVQDQLNVQEFNLGVEGTRGSRVNSDILWGLKQLDNQRVATLS